jgi:hypothetical protein
MICVVKTEPTSCLRELLRRETFEGSLCRYWHENGEGHGALRKVQGRSAGFGNLAYVRGVTVTTMSDITEHFPTNSNVRAEGIGTGAMVFDDTTRRVTEQQIQKNQAGVRDGEVSAETVSRIRPTLPPDPHASHFSDFE